LGAVEDFLRDYGMGKTEAKALLSHVKRLGQRDAAESQALREMTEALKRRGAVAGIGPRDAEDDLRQLAAALKRRGDLMAA
jgi:hypothetical protein